MNKTATVSELRHILGNGRFATITFEKLDGSIRRLNGRIGVSKGVNGNGSSNPYVVKVYDVQRDAEGNIKGWRTVKPEKVMQIVANHMVHDFVKGEVTPFIVDVFRVQDVTYVRMAKAVYKYFGVPMYIFNAFCTAESRGTYFNEHIKGKYVFDKV